MAAGLVGLVLGISAAYLCTRSLTRAAQDLSGRLADIACGKADLGARLPEVRSDELGDAARSFNRFVGQLAEIVHKIMQPASSITASATNISETSEQVSARTKSCSPLDSQHVASVDTLNMQTVVDQLAMMGGNIHRMVENTELSALAVDEARRVVGDSAESVVELQQSATDIDRILEVIEEIAA
jgi:methyl-accepting chemotaxis protein